MSERNPGRYFLGAGLFGLLTGTLYMKYTNAYHELQAFNSAQPCNKLSELKDVEDGKLVLVRGKATTKTPLSCEFTIGPGGVPAKSLRRELKVTRLWKDRKSPGDPWVQHESIKKHIIETVPTVRLVDDTEKVQFDPKLIANVPPILSYENHFCPKVFETTNKLHRNEKEIGIHAQEFNIPPAIMLTCVGTLRKDNGKLNLTNENKAFVLTTDTPAQVKAKYEQNTNTWLAGCASAGLVTGALFVVGAMKYNS